MNESSPARVVTMGESLALFAQAEPALLRSGAGFTFRIGGAESNVAIGLARLDVETAWMGRVGRDPFGDEIVRSLRGEGVRALVHRDEQLPTGLMVKDRRTSHHQQVSYYRAGSAGAAFNVHDVDEDAIAAADVLHITGITLAISSTAAEAVHRAVHAARANATTVSFDVNHRSRLWDADTARAAITPLLPHVDLLFAGPDEADLVLGSAHAAEPLRAARRLQALGPEEVVIKRGELGAIAALGDSEASTPAIPVSVVDTVGAGDAFVAGYLAARLAGSPLQDRLHFACRTGAFACMSAGDWEGAAHLAELSLLDDTEPVRR